MLQYKDRRYSTYLRYSLPSFFHLPSSISFSLLDCFLVCLRVSLFHLFPSFLLFTSVSRFVSIYRFILYAYIYFNPCLKAKTYLNCTTYISVFSSIFRQHTILKSVSSFVSICKKASRIAKNLYCVVYFAGATSHA